MKKAALMFALAALPLAFTSCGNDDDPENITLDRSSVTINYGETATVTASEKNADWASSNTFVATVDSKGVITAKHAGTAVITVSKNGESATCNVTVEATNNNFVIPVITWNEKQAAVKSQAEKLTSNLSLYQENETTLAFTTGGNFPIYVYSFDKDGYLNGSSLTVSVEQDEQGDFQGFLEQRYALYNETDTSFQYCDGNSLSEANVAVEYGYDSASEAVMATWLPVSHTDSRAMSMESNQVRDQHLDVVRKMLNK